MKELDPFSWAVGFWEGEGTVGWAANKYPVITASQQDPEILHRLVSVWGGRVRGPYKSGKKVIYRWVLTLSSTDDWIQEVRPHLSVRRQEQLDAFAAGYNAWADWSAKHK